MIDQKLVHLFTQDTWLSGESTRNMRRDENSIIITAYRIIVCVFGMHKCSEMSCGGNIHEIQENNDRIAVCRM